MNRTLKARLAAVGVFSGLLAAAFVTEDAFSQAAPGSAGSAKEFAKMSRDYNERGLATPFLGVTTNGTIQPGLFEVRSTGVSTEPVRKAAEAFLASLTDEQRDKTTFPADDPEWRKWMNQHFYVREGARFQEMTEAQREKAFGLLQAALSAKGLRLTRDIMKLNETLAELTNDREFLGEWLYHFTVMGQPSATEPWGFQFEGHHAIINYFVLGDQVVMTPFFAGSEPIRATSGKYKGTVILQEEQDKGLAFMQSLSEVQRKQATLSADKPGNKNLAEAFKDNIVLDYAGLRVSEATAAQRKQLTDLIGLFVGNMDDGHAKVKMEEVAKHLDETRFAWIGGAESDSVFYFRIHSPVILIEFDHLTPVNLAPFTSVRTPTREHIHVVVRTPNGNDYGKDLLRQHYAMHPHNSARVAAR
jgi:hypothetical protein